MADWLQKTPMLPGVTATRQPATSYALTSSAPAGSTFTTSRLTPLPGLTSSAPAPSTFIQPYQQPFAPSQPSASPGSYLPTGTFGQAPAGTTGGTSQQQQPAQSPSGGTKPTTWVTPATNSSGYTMGTQPNSTITPIPNFYTKGAPPPMPTMNYGALTGPGHYEQWYEQNKGRYNQPLTLEDYFTDNRSKFENYNFDPSTTQGAYGDLQSRLGGTSFGTQQSRDISQQLRNPLTGEAYYGQAGDMLQGPNLATDYANSTRDFFGTPTNSQGLYGSLSPELQKAGFGESMVQNELPGLNTVGAEFDYFRDPLRSKSYSESLYESGNQGLNLFYDRERERQQEALERRMAATGVFGSGETVKGLSEISAELGAQQARDMAGLAGQADEAFRGRTGLARDFASASSGEDLSRMGLGLDLDRLGLDRYDKLIGLAGQADDTSLARIKGGSDVMRSGDDSRRLFGDSLRLLGDSATGTELDRLKASSDIGLAGDAEDRLRANDVFSAGEKLDRLRLDSDKTALDYLQRGGDMASNIDDSKLDWLNAGGDAASLAQDKYETRERYPLQDSLDLAKAQSALFYGGAQGATSEQIGMQGEAIDLLMQGYGMDYQTAMQTAQSWSSLGELGVRLAEMKGGNFSGGGK